MSRSWAFSSASEVRSVTSARSRSAPPTASRVSSTVDAAASAVAAAFSS
ncbi:hypothetical protein ABGB17_16635 [Sphaerisporangium sp. B11E5]